MTRSPRRPTEAYDATQNDDETLTTASTSVAMKRECRAMPALPMRVEDDDMAIKRSNSTVIQSSDSFSNRIPLCASSEQRTFPNTTYIGCKRVVKSSRIHRNLKKGIKTDFEGLIPFAKDSTHITLSNKADTGIRRRDIYNQTVLITFSRLQRLPIIWLQVST